MLRLHFTGEDLSRTVLADEPDAMWELSISLHRLQRRDAGVVFGPWRTGVLPRIPAEVRLLSQLAPARGYCVDFLTPAQGAPLTAQLEAIRSTARATALANLEEFDRQHPQRRLPAWCSRLAAGEAFMLGRLADAASGYFDACLSPYWEAIRAQVHRDHVRRTAALAKGGWDAVFRTLHPSARWSFPVLELAYPVEQDLHLQGRGLVLQPSFFCRYGVTSLFDPLLPPVLVHPIDHDPAWARPARAPQAATALACLLGSTRAELLQAAADGPATTRELSRRIRTSSPNASRHLTALREAGLLRHHRHRNTVLHSVTDLGTALLNGRLPALPT